MMCSSGRTIWLVLLFPLVAFTPQAALAHGRVHTARPVPIKGVIVGVSQSSVTIQTQTSTVSAQIGAGTHIMRLVNGSGADLTNGALVHLRVLPGGTQVVGVQIDTAPPNALKPSTKSPHTPLGGHATHTAGAGTPLRHTPNGTHHADGQIVRVNGDLLTISAGHGSTATFILMPGVKIIKDMKGHSTDLASGEQVQAVVTQAGQALSITIVSG
jgi:hypothetical protein